MLELKERTGRVLHRGRVHNSVHRAKPTADLVGREHRFYHKLFFLCFWEYSPEHLRLQLDGNGCRGSSGLAKGKLQSKLGLGEPRNH